MLCVITSPWGEIIAAIVAFFVGFAVNWVLNTNKGIQANKADIALLREEATKDLQLATQSLQSSIVALDKNLTRFEKSMEWIVRTLREHQDEIISLKSWQTQQEK